MSEEVCLDVLLSLLQLGLAVANDLHISLQDLRRVVLAEHQGYAALETVSLAKLLVVELLFVNVFNKTGEDIATLPRMSFPRMGNGLFCKCERRSLCDSRRLTQAPTPILLKQQPNIFVCTRVRTKYIIRRPGFTPGRCPFTVVLMLIITFNWICVVTLCKQRPL